MYVWHKQRKRQCCCIQILDTFINTMAAMTYLHANRMLSFNKKLKRRGRERDICSWKENF